MKSSIGEKLPLEEYVKKKLKNVLQRDKQRHWIV